jgi:hypothetical protein
MHPPNHLQPTRSSIIQLVASLQEIQQEPEILKAFLSSSSTRVTISVVLGYGFVMLHSVTVLTNFIGGQSEGG